MFECSLGASRSSIGASNMQKALSGERTHPPRCYHGVPTEWVFGGPLTLNPSFSLHQKDVPLPDTVAPGGLPTNKAKEKAGTSRQTVRVFQWCRHNSHDEGMVRAWSGEPTF